MGLALDQLHATPGLNTEHLPGNKRSSRCMKRGKFAEQTYPAITKLLPSGKQE